MKAVAQVCLISGSLLAASWLVWAVLLSDRMAGISRGVIRLLTLPGEADAWPTRSQDLAYLLSACLPLVLGVCLLLGGCLLRGRNRH